MHCNCSKEECPNIDPGKEVTQLLGSKMEKLNSSIEKDMLKCTNLS